MTKDTDGIWSYTTQPLPSELYTYAFNVDGLHMNDPNNVYYRRDVARTYMAQLEDLPLRVPADAIFFNF